MEVEHLYEDPGICFCVSGPHEIRVVVIGDVDAFPEFLRADYGIRQGDYGQEN